MKSFIAIALLTCITIQYSHAQTDTGFGRRMAQMVVDVSKENIKLYESLDSAGKESVKKFSKQMYEDNLRNTKLYTCNMELVRLQREASSSKTSASQDAVIAKASSCLEIQPSAIPYEVRARAYTDKGEWDKALSDYASALKESKKTRAEITKTNEQMGGKAFQKNVDNAISYETDIYTARADVYILKGDKTNAVNDLKAALELTPNSYSASSDLKDIDKKIAEKQKDYHIAHPKTSADFVLVGDSKNYPSKSAEAIAAYTQAITLDAKNADAYIGRGDAYRQAGTLDKAMDDYRKASTLAPQNPKSYEGAGYVYRDKKEYKNAISDFSTAIKLSPENTWLLIARARCYRDDGQLEPAMNDFKSVLVKAKDKKDPDAARYDSIAAWSGGGDIMRMAGKPNEAVAFYGQAIAKGTNIFSKLDLLSTYVECGKLYAAAGQLPLAAAHFKEALKTSPGYKDAAAELAKVQAKVSAGPTPATAEQWTIRGKQQYDVADYDNAINSFTQAITIDTRATLAYALRGASYIAKDKIKESRSDFDRATGLDPRNINVYFIRATILLEKEKKTEAAADLRKILEIDPNNQTAKAFLAKATS